MKLLVNRGATLSHYNYKHESELAAAEVYLDSEGYHKVKELLGGLIDHYHDS